MHLPRILIFGQPFNDKYGGGITLSNMFRGWDTDSIAVAATGHVMFGATTDICRNYFQLGFNEFRWRFPFNLIQRKFPSGALSLNTGESKQNKNRQSKRRKLIVDKVFYPVLKWMGLYHLLAEIRLTPEFKTWLSDFNPEVLYLQVSTRETILFAIKLIEYLKVPSVIHIMDDWPSTISRKGLLRRYWNRRIDKEFRCLLDRIDLFLSISDSMSSEYKKRYNKSFIAFHNPIDIPSWSRNIKSDYRFSDNHIRVLFSGRIGIGIAESLVDLAQVVEELSEAGMRIKLYIQSPSRSNKLSGRVKNFKSLVFNPVANYSELPGIFSSADILAITNDFDKKSINYLKYSMPTKASEYMISGTPVLVYSHSETAVAKFFSENRCGYCITDRNMALLKDALLLLIEDEQLRHELGANAVRIAKELFDAKIVRAKFQNLIRETSLMTSHIT